MIQLGQGRWAVSRIIEEEPRSFSTAAMLRLVGNARAIENLYPPMLPDFSGYVLPWALVRLDDPQGTLDVDSTLLPAFNQDDALSRLSVRDRNALRGALELVPGFSTASFGNSATPAQILRALLAYFGHSESRVKPQTRETHNTEFLDNFSTDPAARWTVEDGTQTWDSANSEYDCNTGSTPMHRYSANGPGSIEHESQVTGATSSNRSVGAGTRHDNAGVNDCYMSYFGGSNALAMSRFNAGTRTALHSWATGATISAGDFITIRQSSAGAVGANVVLNWWFTHHGASKPSDPGWIGVDASPNTTVTDTSASRLDDAAHVHCGMGGRGPTGFDTRNCFWKSRAISDRGGGAFNLTMTDLGHAHTLDVPALVQANTLAMSALAHPHALDTTALIQANALAVAELAQAHSIDPLTLAQANVLAIIDLAHAHVLDAPVLQVGDVTLVVADLDHAHTFDAITLTQANVLQLVDLIHDHDLDAVVLLSGDILDVLSLDHSHMADAVVLTQANVLALADLMHGHVIESLGLVQANTLTVADLAHAHGNDAVVLVADGGIQLVVAALDHNHVLDPVVLTQAFILTIADLEHLHGLGGPVLQLIGAVPILSTSLGDVTEGRGLIDSSPRYGLTE